MAFLSYYKALFTEPLILQLIALVQRDMQTALNAVTGVTYPAAGSLQTFAEYNLAILPPENPPSLIVTPPARLLIDENSQQTERSRGQVDFLISIANQDRNILAQWVQRYLRALSYVLDTEGAPSTPNAGGTGAGADFKNMFSALPISLPFMPTVTTTTPLEPGSLTYMRVVGHNLGGLYSGKFNGFLQTASLSVKIDLEET